MKVCRSCRQYKSHAEFSISLRGNDDGYRSDCRDCYKEKRCATIKRNKSIARRKKAYELGQWRKQRDKIVQEMRVKLAALGLAYI